VYQIGALGTGKMRPGSDVNAAVYSGIMTASAWYNKTYQSRSRKCRKH
jgi:hypothetical protein